MRLLAIVLLVFGAGGVVSSAPQQTAPAVRPPLLFREGWRLPKHEGAATDENTRFTPEVVKSGSLPEFGDVSAWRTSTTRLDD